MNPMQAPNVGPGGKDFGNRKPLSKQELIEKIVRVEDKIADLDGCNIAGFMDRINGLEKMSIPCLKSRLYRRTLDLENVIK